MNKPDRSLRCASRREAALYNSPLHLLKSSPLASLQLPSVQIFDIPKLAKPRTYSLAKALLQNYKQKVKQEASELDLPAWLETMRKYKTYDPKKGDFVPVTDMAEFREAVKVSSERSWCLSAPPTLLRRCKLTCISSCHHSKRRSIRRPNPDSALHQHHVCDIGFFFRLFIDTRTFSNFKHILSFNNISWHCSACACARAGAQARVMISAHSSRIRPESLALPPGLRLSNSN